MIRSMIGFACVLLLVTTCIQSSVAQPRANLSGNSLRSDAVAMSLRAGKQSNFQSISDSILSSDAYHDDFRFRAAPVKRSANWQMPIVDVRPAKQILVDFVKPEAVKETTKVAFDFNIRHFVDSICSAANTASAEFCQVRDRFEEITLAIVPRPVAVLHGQQDYWNYYEDCDRWNVVFAIAWQREAVRQEEKPDYAAASKVSWDESTKLIWKNAVNSLKASWKDVSLAYQRIAQQFSVSKR